MQRSRATQPPPAKVLLYARLKFDTPKAKEVLRRLSKLFFVP
jgi:hypothetical protein